MADSKGSKYYNIFLVFVMAEQEKLKEAFTHLIHLLHEKTIVCE